MRQAVSTITSKGQVTLPVVVRKPPDLGERDTVAFAIGDDGIEEVRTLAFPTIASLAGAAGSLPRPMARDEMLDIAREDHFAAEYGPR